MSWSSDFEVWGCIVWLVVSVTVTVIQIKNVKSLVIFCLLCLFVWNKKHICKPLNLYQSNSTEASKPAQLIYDTGGLMPKQWMITLLWIIFIKLLHSLIMHRSAWQISWMHWWGWTVTVVCVSARLYACRRVIVIQIWRSPRNMVPSTGKLTKRSCTNLHEGAKAENKAGARGEHILLCYLLLAAPCWNAFLEFQNFCYWEFEWTVCLTTPSHREQDEEKHWSEVSACTWCVSNIPQLFSWKVIHLRKTTQASPLTAQNIVYCIIWSLCGAVANTFILLTKINSSPLDIV